MPRLSSCLEKVRKMSFVLQRMGYSPILCKRVPKSRGLRNEIMSEAHHSLYIVHPGGTKMYQDVKGSYWWNNMK